LDSLKALDPNRPIREADIAEHQLDVRFVPQADIPRCGKERRYSITPSARASIDCGVSDHAKYDQLPRGLCPLSRHTALEFAQPNFEHLTASRLS
jgi:hypothetical protein